MQYDDRVRELANEIRAKDMEIERLSAALRNATQVITPYMLKHHILLEDSNLCWRGYGRKLKHHFMHWCTCIDTGALLRYQSQRITNRSTMNS
jgi:hypothetical protein